MQCPKASSSVYLCVCMFVILFIHSVFVEMSTQPIILLPHFFPCPLSFFQFPSFFFHVEIVVCIHVYLVSFNCWNDPAGRKKSFCHTFRETERERGPEVILPSETHEYQITYFIILILVRSRRYATARWCSNRMKYQI